MGKIANFFLATPENKYRPPVLSYKAFLIYALILLLLRILLGALPTKGSAVDSGIIMALVNQERTSRNLQALYSNQSLLKAAAEKTQDMFARGYFSHVDPDGNYVWPKIAAAGYTPYKILGENLALDFSTSEGMVQAWINSPSHRENLLNPDFMDQGLSAQYGTFQGRYTDLTTSLFGALAQVTKSAPQVKPQTTSPAPKPPAPAAPPPSPPEATTTLATKNPKQEVPGPIPRETPKTAFAPTSPVAGLPPPTTAVNLHAAFVASRIIFTLFGLLLLVILTTDSVIIHRQSITVARSRSAYHLLTFILIALISILIWWW